MQKTLAIIITTILILFSLSPGFAGDESENHICFKQVDSNHDEIVTFQEFEKFYGNDPERFQAMDQDNDKKITHDEYEEYLYNQE